MNRQPAFYRPITPPSLGTFGCVSTSKVSLGQSRSVTRSDSMRSDSRPSVTTSIDLANVIDIGSSTSSPSPENYAGRLLAFQVAESALLGDGDDEDDDDEGKDTFLWDRLRSSSAANQPRSRSPTPPPLLSSFAADWMSSPASVPSSSPPRTPRRAATRPEAIKTSSKLSPRASPFVSATVTTARPPTTTAAVRTPTFALPWERPSAPAARRPTHNRSYSGHTYSFITTTPPTPDPSRVDQQAMAPAQHDVQPSEEGDAQDTFLAAPPPPRSLTPQPFKRPAFAEEMHEQRAAAAAIASSSLLNCGRRPGLPSLAEIRAAVESRDAISEVQRRRLTSTSQKRMSVESTSSCGSIESLGRGYGDDAASESSAASSEPSTPVRSSRLPLFLLQQGGGRRRGSSSATDADQTTCSRPVVIRDSAEDGEDTSACPLLRVIPPTLDTKLKQQQQQPALPVITWTPATAPGIKISPFAELERQADARRVERGKAMISALGRRTQTQM